MSHNRMTSMDAITRQALTRAQNALALIRSASVTGPQSEPYDLGAVLRHLVDRTDLPRREADRSARIRDGLVRTDVPIMGGVFVPWGAFFARDLTVDTNSAGGFTVAKGAVAGRVVAELGTASQVLAAGATLVRDIESDLAFPVLDSTGSLNWLSTEGATPTEHTPAFASVKLTPRLAHGFVDISRRLIKQSAADIANVVQEYMRRAAARAIDRAALIGTGTGGEPAGVLPTTGIGSVAMGTNGAALTRAKVLEFVQDLQTSLAFSAESRPAFMLNGNTAISGQKIEESAGSGRFLFEPDPSAMSGRLCGYEARVDNHLPANGTKGTGTNLSTMIFGDWTQLYVGLFGGGVELAVDPYTAATSGTVRINLYLAMDVAIPHPASFAASTDIVTT